MANTKSAIKSARQSIKRNAANKSIITTLKSGQKRFRGLVAEGNLEAAKTEFVSIVSKLDKAAKRGVIHQNAADRRKSAFARAIKAPAAA
ncbi:MAG: 30S ribosomal protein S20 [Chthoniobacterales bacterium]|jgi:small subunit ribosomal protein S20